MKPISIREHDEYFRIDQYEMDWCMDHEVGLIPGCSFRVLNNPSVPPNTRYRFWIAKRQKGAAVFSFDIKGNVEQTAGSWRIRGEELDIVKYFTAQNIKALMSFIDQPTDGDLCFGILISSTPVHRKSATALKLRTKTDWMYDIKLGTY